MSITAQDVKKLRDATGVGMMDAQKALQEAQGNLELAIEHLRKSSAKIAAKKLDREAHEGLVVSYIHAGGKVGVLLEVNCETDFVARTEDFASFCRDIALHIAAAAPEFLTKEDVPQDVIAKEREIYIGQMAADPTNEKKPEDVKEKILQGKIDKFLAEKCLLSQSFIKDPTKTVQQLMQETIAKVGENIRIKRFSRFALAG